MVFDVVNLTSCCSSKVNVWTTALALDLWNTGDKTIRDQELRPSFSRAFFFSPSSYLLEVWLAISCWDQNILKLDDKPKTAD